MGIGKANEDNRNIFLNAKQTIVDSGIASNVDIPYEDENYTIACNMRADMRLAFGVNKRKPLAFMKASVKCGRLSDEQIRQVCDALVEEKDSITYEISGDKAVFQAVTPLAGEEYAENNRTVYESLKEFVEVMSKCSHEATGGGVISLAYSEYRRQGKKPMSISPDTEIMEEDMERNERNRKDAETEKEAKEISPSTRDSGAKKNPVPEKKPAKSVPSSSSAGGQQSEKSVDKPFGKQPEKRDQQSRKEFQKRESQTKPEAKQAKPDIQQAGRQKPVQSSQDQQQRQQGNTVQQNRQKDDMGRRENFRQQKQEQATKPVEKQMDADRNASENRDVFLQYADELKGMENKYRHILSGMGMQELFSIIENRHCTDGDSFAAYARERLCNIAKDVLAGRMSGSV